MIYSFWFDVAKSLIGTAAGSALGLGSALLVWRIQQRRAELAMGNVTVLTLGQYVRLCSTSSGPSGKNRRRYKGKRLAPPMGTVRAIHTAFKSDLGIDLKQLSFLADKPLLLEKLAYAERLYLISLKRSTSTERLTFKFKKRRPAHLPHMLSLLSAR